MRLRREIFEPTAMASIVIAVFVAIAVFVVTGWQTPKRSTKSITSLGLWPSTRSWYERLGHARLGHEQIVTHASAKFNVPEFHYKSLQVRVRYARACRWSLLALQRIGGECGYAVAAARERHG